jgi:hypothetical protein
MARWCAIGSSPMMQLSAAALLLSSAAAAKRPRDPASPLEQAAVCDANLSRHVSSRQVDLKHGVLEWNCGDVPGVAGDALGIEYCEYRAVHAGKPVNSAAEIAGKQGKVSCVFTGVFSDVKSSKTPHNGQKENQEQGNALAAALKDQANLGTAEAPIRSVALMINGSNNNSRSAAISLIASCSSEVRMDFDPAQIAAQFHPADDERRKDIAACLPVRVLALAAEGVPWRNSDTMICTHVYRAHHECGATFSAIPSTLEGFEFTGWSDALPSGCRYAKVSGKDFKHIVICDLTDSERALVAAQPAWRTDLRQFCHDRFANNLVMKAPLKALVSNKQALKKQGAFCAAFDAGVQ